MMCTWLQIPRMKKLKHIVCYMIETAPLGKYTNICVVTTIFVRFASRCCKWGHFRKIPTARKVASRDLPQILNSPKIWAHKRGTLSAQPRIHIALCRSGKHNYRYLPTMSFLVMSLTQLRRVVLPQRTIIGSRCLQLNDLLQQPSQYKYFSTTSETPSNTDITKTKIVDSIAETHGLSKSQSERILNTVIDTIVEVSPITVFLLLLMILCC